jgi:hypothetical protein
VISAERAHDSYLYWSFDLTDPYGSTVLGVGKGFVYSPVIAQLLVPLRYLPWQAFLGVWTTLMLACALYLLRPNVLALIVLPFVGAELWEGNLHLLYGAVAVAGVRSSAVWLLPFFSKITPSLGALWFAFRGEWRALVRPLIFAALLVAVSVALTPSWWSGWAQSLVRSVGAVDPWAIGIPLWLRLPFAAGLLLWGARTGRPWVLPVVILLSLPSIRAGSFALLLAVPPLLSAELRLRGIARLRGTADRAAFSRPETAGS